MTDGHEAPCAVFTKLPSKGYPGTRGSSHVLRGEQKSSARQLNGKKNVFCLKSSIGLGLGLLPPCPPEGQKQINYGYFSSEEPRSHGFKRNFSEFIGFNLKRYSTMIYESTSLISPSSGDSL